MTYSTEKISELLTKLINTYCYFKFNIYIFISISLQINYI